MTVEYFYCSHCGFEGYDVSVAFAATYANGDFYYCPECKCLIRVQEEDE